MRAVQITRFGGPEVLDVVDLPDPTPGPGQQLYEVSAAGVNFADTHHKGPLSRRLGKYRGSSRSSYRFRTA
jgi:NADPH:quinone reductase-like Zn-dependent oxidoreductase